MIRLQLTSITIFAVFVISTIPFVLSYEYWDSDFTVPSWIKNNAGWWADDQINDDSFVSGIQWMITNDVVILPPTELGEGDGENVIPRWVKSTAGWWSNDEINDATFVAALKYLIGEGIIIIEQETEVEEVQEVEELVEVEEVRDFYMRVNGGNCCLNWVYVNDDYRFQIETFDEKHGNSIDGVTITAKIISKDGELRYDIGQITTEDGIYVGSVHIPSIDWYAENILSVTGEYYGVEKTIEKEFEVFAKKGAKSGCGSAANPFSILDRDGQMTSITFNDDGSKMFLVGLDNDKVHEYKLCKNYNLGSISYTTSFSVTAREISPHGIAFNDVGTKMFIVGQAGNDLNEYALSTAWDISTASFTGNGYTESKTGTKYSAINFNADGTKLLILDKQSNKVREFVMSTAYSRANGDTGCDYTAANDSTDLNGLSGVEDAKAQGMAFNDDGKEMYIVGEQHDKVYQISLSTGYDVSENTSVASFDISDQESSPTGLEFSSDGKWMFVVGKNGDEINVYGLTTAWDISTAYHK